MVSATQTSASPQTILYKINPKAVWSDGTPITYKDFVYSYQAQSGLPQFTDIGGKAYAPASTSGYSQIQTIGEFNNDPDPGAGRLQDALPRLAGPVRGSNDPLLPAQNQGTRWPTTTGTPIR